MRGEVRTELDQTVRSTDDATNTSCDASCIPSRPAGEHARVASPDEVDGLFRRSRMTTIHWVSVMDGLQRVILFTEDKNLATSIRKVQ